MDLATGDLGTAALIGTLAVLALIDSTSFGTLLVPVWLLTAPGRPRAGRMMAYLGTVAAFYLGVGIAVMLGAGLVLDRFGDALESRPAYVVQLVVGVALFAVSFRFDRKRTEARRQQQAARGRPGRLSRWRERALGIESSTAAVQGSGTGTLPGSVLPLVGLAIGAASLEVATMLPYLTAIGILASSGLSSTTSVAVLAGYCLVMILPAVVLLVARLGAARAVDPLLRRLDGWLTRNAEEMTGWVLAILGVLLTLDAVGNLGLGTGLQNVAVVRIP